MSQLKTNVLHLQFLILICVSFASQCYDLNRKDKSLQLNFLQNHIYAMMLKMLLFERCTAMQFGARWCKIIIFVSVLTFDRLLQLTGVRLVKLLVLDGYIRLSLFLSQNFLPNAKYAKDIHIFHVMLLLIMSWYM